MTDGQCRSRDSAALTRRRSQTDGSCMKLFFLVSFVAGLIIGAVIIVMMVFTLAAHRR